MNVTMEEPPTPDIADIVAGQLGVSRGTAYELMWDALKESALFEEKSGRVLALARKWAKANRTTETRLQTLVTTAKGAKRSRVLNDARLMWALRDL